jgi:transcriptional regulator with XRE-family HTH domain
MDKFSIPTPQDIQDAAKSRGWSIKRLCDEAGLSTETFFRWRDGKHTIGVSKLQAMLDVLSRPE